MEPREVFATADEIRGVIGPLMDGAVFYIVAPSEGCIGEWWSAHRAPADAEDERARMDGNPNEDEHVPLDMTVVMTCRIAGETAEQWNSYDPCPWVDAGARSMTKGGA